MNRSARRMFGGDLADFVNQPISHRGHARADAPVPPHALPRRAGRGPGRDLRVPRQGARRARVLGRRQRRGHRRASRTGRQLTYALLDIERRRQAEARMAEAQASLQRIIETAPLAIALRDARTLRVLQVNQVAARSARPRRRRAGRRARPSRCSTPELAARAPRRHGGGAGRGASVTQREYRIEGDGEPQRVGRALPAAGRAPGAAARPAAAGRHRRDRAACRAGGAARGGDRAARDAGQGSAPPHQEQPAGRGRPAAADRAAQARGGRR